MIRRYASISMVWGCVCGCGIGVLAFVSPQLCAQPLRAMTSNATGPQTGKTTSFTLDQPIIIQRVLVPSDSILAFVSTQPLRPVRAEEFQAAVRSIQELTNGPPVVRVTQAEYRARWQSGALVDGRAVLDIELRGNNRQGLRLSPMSLALHSVWWSENPNVMAEIVATDEEPAVVMVDRSGKLQFTWSMVANESTDGLVFVLSLPRCPRCRLELELPSAMEPEVPGAIVRRLNQNPTNDRTIPPESLPITSADPSENSHWEIDFGGEIQAKLMLRDTSVATRQGLTTTWMSDTHYQLTRSGIEVQGTLRISPANLSTRELELVADPELTIDGLKLQGIPSDLSTVSLSTGDKRIRIPLPMVDRGLISLEWHGLAILPAKKFQIPAISVTNAWWLASTSTIDIDEELFLVDFDAKDCRTSSFEVRQPTSSLIVNHLLAEARIQLACEPPRDRHRSRIAHSAKLEESNIACVSRLAVDVEGTMPLRSLQLDLAADWQIDAITSNATTLPWEIQEIKTAVRRLLVFLPTPVEPRSSLPIEIHASRRSNRQPGEPEALSAIQPVVDSEAVSSEVLLSLSAPTEYRVRISNQVGIEWVDVDLPSFAHEWKDLLSDYATRRNFKLTQQASEAQVFLDREIPRYRAEVEINIIATQAQTLREVRIRCIPEGSAITQLPIQWTSSNIGDWEWSLHNHSADTISVRTDASGDRSDAEAGGPINWISFSEAMSREFTLVATSVADSRLNKDVALVAVPQATDQQGTVQVFVDESWNWNASGSLVQLPFDPQGVLATHRAPSMGARYRYDPSAVTGGPILELLPVNPSDPHLPTAWIWQQHIVNRIAQNGSSEHLNTYYVENFGADHFQIRLPAATTICEIYRDGQRIDAMTDRVSGANVQLPLIPHQKYSVFTICYHSFRPPLRLHEVVQFDRATCTLPIHSTRESTVIPPGYIGNSPQSESTVSTTLRQRLCGPFSPLVSLETPSWSLWDMAFVRRFDRGAVNAEIENMIDTIVKATARTAGALNCRDLLLTAASAVPEIRIDPAACQRIGLRPESLVPTRDFQPLSGRELGIALLQKMGLVAIGTPRGICLTDQTRVNLIRGYRPSYPNTTIIVADDDSSTRSLQQLFDGCEQVSDWITQQWPFVSQVIHSTDLQLTDARERGWTVVESAESPRADLSVTIHRSDSFHAMGWTALLIAFAVFFRLRHLGRGFILASGCLSVVLALLVPPPYYLLASGIWLGWCCAMLALFAYRSVESRSARQGIPQVIVSIIGSAVLLTQIAAPAMSVEPSPGTTENRSDLADRFSNADLGRVLVPYEENEPNKRGPYVYMSSELYRGLAEQTRKLKSLPGAWWIAEANYELMAEMQQGLGTVTNVVARIKVGTHAPNIEISLPFRRKQIRLMGVRRDSDRTSIPAYWRPDGEALMIRCPDPGMIPLRIEFTLEEPQIQSKQGISFQVPQVAVSQVNLRVATSQASTSCPLQITSAAGVARWDTAKQTLIATLGGSQHLSIDFAQPSQNEPDSAVGTMDQRISAVFAPGGIRLNIVGTWKLSASGPRTIPWNIDPQWQLIEYPTSESIPWTVRRISPQRLVCETTQQLPIRGSIHLTFLVPVDQTTTIFSLPTAESPALPTQSRLLDWQVKGLSSIPQPLTNGVQLLPVRREATATLQDTDNDTGSTAAFTIPDRESRWLLTWDTYDRKLEGEREIIYSLESDRITAHFAAEIDATSQTPRFQRIDIPSGWSAKRVEVRQLGKRIPLQWSQSSSSNHVAVWSESPLDGHYRVTCVAEQLLPEQGQMALPSMSVQGVAWRASIWKVAPPGNDVRWELDHADSVRDAASELVTNPENDSWRDEAPRVLRWYPNVPRGKNQVATYLEHRGGAWHAVVMGQLSVSNGRFDELRLEIPAEWQDRLVMENIDYDFQLAANPNRVTLVIRPLKPVTKSLQYRFECTLNATNGPDTVAPIVESPDVEQDERFLVVPKMVSDQTWTWQADGLSRTDQLPEGVRRSELHLEQVIYRAAGNRFRLAGRPEERALESPEVLLCDAYFRLLTDGAFVGTVTFDVASRLVGACVIAAPPGVSLEQVTVNGQLPPGQRTSASQWRIEFGNTEFPQRISVAFHGKSGRNQSTKNLGERLTIPVLQNPAGTPWPSQHTLWTIDSRRNVHDTIHGVPACNELDQRLVRLQHAQRLISDVQQRFGRNLESQSWTTGWSARWKRLTALPIDNTVTDEQRIAFDSFVEWARSSSGALSPSATLGATGIEFEIGGNTGSVSTSGGNVVRCSLSGWHSEITLQASGMSAQSRAFFATIFTCTAAIFLAIVLHYSVTARSWCLRSQTLLTVAAGFASILWLVPTVLGYVIVAVAIGAGWNRIRAYLAI